MVIKVCGYRSQLVFIGHPGLRTVTSSSTAQVELSAWISPQNSETY